MATGGFGPGTTPTTPNNNQALLQRLRAEQVVKSGAGWFIWIAGLSLVNSLVTLFGGGFHFIVGLGITQVVDALAHRAGSTGIVLDLVINGLVAGIFVLFWHFGRQGQRWAFIVGMVFYTLDGLLLLMFQDYLSVAFHAYALFMLYRGMAGISQLEQTSQATMLAGASIDPK